ncbi:unnamed protein product [Calypogeia fissa]
MPKGTPQEASGRPQRKVTIKAERAASRPQASSRALEEDGDFQMIDRVKRTVEVHEIESDINLKLVRINRVDLEIVAKAQQEGHKQFWADMGLGEFAALNWNCTVGFEDEWREFLRNYNKDSTMANNRPINLSEKRLATIFKSGDKTDRRAGLRAKQWQSHKFFGAKEKNEYKWSQCTDPAMVERLEFMRTTLYIHDKKTTVSGSMV